MTPTTLITGAAGFLGASLARALLQRGEDLRLLVRPGSSLVNVAGLPAEIVIGDLGDEASLRAALADVEQVYHCAQKVSLHRRDRKQLWRTNVEGSARLARLARERGGLRFVHVSSMAAVGYCEPGQPWLDEKAPYNLDKLRIAYCDSKHAAEDAVMTEVAQGLDAVIVNPSLVLGPGDLRSPRYSPLLAIAAKQVPLAPGGGLNVVDIRDVVSGMILAMEHGRCGERYILGGQDLTYVRLIEKTQRVLGREPRVRELPRAAHGALRAAACFAQHARLSRSALSNAMLRLAGKRLYFCSDKAATELGYAAYPIEMAIKSCFDQWLDRDQIDRDLVAGLGRL